MGDNCDEFISSSAEGIMAQSTPFQTNISSCFAETDDWAPREIIPLCDIFKENHIAKEGSSTVLLSRPHDINPSS